MNNENCPCCSNNCPKDNLGCRRGIEHFNNQSVNNIEFKSIDEQVVVDLRRCGHLLHHNKDLDSKELLKEFTKEELNKLHELLSKIK